MTDYSKTLEAVADSYGVNVADITGGCRRTEVVNAKRMLCLLYKNKSNREIGEIIGLTPSSITYNKSIAFSEIEWDKDFQKKHAEITSKLYKEMTVKLTNSQLRSLADLLNNYLENQAGNMADELIHLHLSDVFEKLYKRARNNKENISLDDKQRLAISLWYRSFGRGYRPPEAEHHAYITLIDIINQIKPYEDTHRDPGGNRKALSSD